jgi:hypothetical protein
VQDATEIKNFARGGGPFHQHRRSIIRSALDRDTGVQRLAPFLRDKLFALRDGWRAFGFTSKDWDLADGVLLDRSTALERRMLALGTAYIESNIAAILKLYAVGDRITGQILSAENKLIVVDPEVMGPIEWQSLFGFRLLCGTNEKSSKDMRQALERVMAPNEWCRSRLMYPLIDQTVNRTRPEAVDNFLEYFMSGQERLSEKTAMKLLLSNEAARANPLSYKIYVGLMGHPFDMIEMIVDHVEFTLAEAGHVPSHLRMAITAMAGLLPGTRVADASEFLESPRPIRIAPGVPDAMAHRLKRYQLGEREVEFLSSFGTIGHFDAPQLPETLRPIAILSNMRGSPYPLPEQFNSLMADLSVWSFVDGGRIISALLRSLYMVDRVRQDLEGRDIVRLISLFGHISPFIATAPGAMPLIRRLHASGSYPVEAVLLLESTAGSALKMAEPSQRLWIHSLQWQLRTLEEGGRVECWLSKVRKEAKVRPLYLSGINWPWVEQIVEQQKLKVFRSFDGAYLLLLMELETQSEPQRLKLVLDRLTRGQSTKDVVDSLIAEFGEYAPAFITRYLTTANLLTSGRASNHFAALSMRIESLETCIRRVGFNQLLPKAVYESETKVLTAELLLLNVNVGKFEVPWESFATYAIEKHRDLYDTLESLRPIVPHEGHSSLVETPRVFRNGQREEYRYRRNDIAPFQLVLQLIEDFLDHPAFGLEMILSGRFRHNNLLQELHAAVTTVGSSEIHPVTPLNAKRLSEAYRPIVERALFQWCSSYLHSRRRDKPGGLFNLIPTSEAMNLLIEQVGGSVDLPSSVMIVFQWIKDCLRPQIEQAAMRFCADMLQELNHSFGNLLERQISECDYSYRPDDARRVHKAVLDAVLRRVEALRPWFDGIDAKTGAPVSLAQLAHATETLFENMMPDRAIVTEPDCSATTVNFGPDDVKVAFDLVREITFNALKHGPAPIVRLVLSRQAGAGPVTFVFSNDVGSDDADDAGLVDGARYTSFDEALTREGNSGRLKIAASAATLLGRDVRLAWTRRSGRYELAVPMRPDEKQSST